MIYTTKGDETISSSDSLFAAIALTVSAGDTLTNNGAITAATNTTVNGTFVNNGTLTAAGAMTVNGEFVNTGDATAGSLNSSSGTVSNSGNLTLSGSSTLGDVTMSGTASLTVTGSSTLTVTGTVEVSGDLSLQIDASSSASIANLKLVGGSSLTLADGSASPTIESVTASFIVSGSSTSATTTALNLANNDVVDFSDIDSIEIDLTAVDLADAENAGIDITLCLIEGITEAVTQAELEALAQNSVIIGLEDSELNLAITYAVQAAEDESGTYVLTATITTAAVPEPATSALGLLALTALAARRRRH